MMEVTWEAHGGNVTLMRLVGEVDGSNFKQLIDAGRQAMASGERHLLLDMSGCGFMSSAGLVALHSLALLARGEEPPDPEFGWSAFHSIGQDSAAGTQRNFKLVAPQPSVRRTLEKTGMVGFLEIFDDLESALASVEAA